MLKRRTLVGAGVAGLALGTLPAAWRTATATADTAPPATGLALPKVGLGTWITFNVGNDPRLRARSVEVMRTFFAEGGGMIDSSPMYGSSQDIVGHGLSELGYPETLFSAEKVWTSSPGDGRGQTDQSLRKWGLDRFDLMQVHNLVAAEAHLERLLDRKAAGEIGHVGITTSHGRRHGDMERLMREYPLDFVQLTYNALDREAEARLLPFARERGIGVIVNRPFRRGALIARTARVPLPGFASEIGADSWAQLLLKFILSHPAVTVAIPATTQPAHMRENKASARGPMPDEAMRQEIARRVAAL